jgi:hypothetical protein
MPLRLNVGASRKVTDNNYGSRGASVNLELELDASLVTEPAKLQERIRDLFDLVRASLAEELNGHGAASNDDREEATPTGDPAARPHSATDGTRGCNGSHRPGPRPATSSQVRALYAIARSRGIDLPQFLRDRFESRRANDLSITQASAAIDALKAAESPAG